MRYFFNLAGAVQYSDTEGSEFASRPEACIEAVRSAGEFLRDRPEVVCTDRELRCEVRDDTGRLVLTFQAALYMSKDNGED